MLNKTIDFSKTGKVFVFLWLIMGMFFGKTLQYLDASYYLSIFSFSGHSKYIVNKESFMIASSFYIVSIPLAIFLFWKHILIEIKNRIKTRLILFSMSLAMLITTLFGDIELESSSKNTSPVRAAIVTLDWIGGAAFQFLIIFFFVFCLILLLKNQNARN